MNDLILYWTKTGHSRKLARAISEALQIPARDLKEKPDFSAVGTLFLVGGIYGGQSDPAMLEELSKIDSSKVSKAVLITSCTSGKSPQNQVRKVLEDKGIKVVEQEQICMGSFLFFRWGRPNQKDLQDAVEFARKQLLT